MTSIAEMIHAKFGELIDPLAGVPDEHRAEAERTTALWANAQRSDLLQLTRLMKGAVMPDWKRGVLARVVASIVLDATGAAGSGPCQCATLA